MNRFCLIFLSAILILGCNQTPSQTEKEYIKNLEEKNKLLEKELQELKSKSLPAQYEKSEQGTDGYFTIGSKEDDVLRVMGEPSSYLVTAPEARQFLYGLSTVYFAQGKVIAYDNIQNNLKVKVKRKP